MEKKKKTENLENGSGQKKMYSGRLRMIFLKSFRLKLPLTTEVIAALKHGKVCRLENKS